MKKPTYFKFFDGYIETLRSCKTHKDRSLLLLAMFDFWDTGKVPEIPAHLQDKWRFLYNSLRISRMKSYERLGEDIEKTEQEKPTDSSSFASKSLESPIDNQQDTSNHYPVTTQPLSTYRIENKELKNKESKSIGCIGCIGNKNTIESSPYHNAQGKAHTSSNTLFPSFPSVDADDWKEATEWTPENEDDVLPSTRKAIANTQSYSNTAMPDTVENSTSIGDNPSTNTSKSSINKHQYSEEEVQRAGEELLVAISRKYFEMGEKPVCYTRVQAEKDLHIERGLYNEAIDDLVDNLKMFRREKYVTSDGTAINSFTISPEHVPTLLNMFKECGIEFRKR